MCSTPKVPDAPKPLAAAPVMPTTIDRKTGTKNSTQSPNIKTSARGIYQPLAGKDILGG